MRNVDAECEMQITQLYLLGKTHMPNGPVRRAQLIAPFGTGAMVVTRNGTSLITCGLDHWYAFDDGRGDADVSEFQLEEWRLQQELDVDHFRQPRLS
jgi:hypothetical protein